MRKKTKLKIVIQICNVMCFCLFFQLGNAQQLREKQEQMENAKIGGTSTSNGSGNTSADLAGPRNSNEPGNPSKSRTNSTLVHIDPLQNDWRQFECNTWHLEPTVRLISWAGKHKSIDPLIH